MTCHLNKCACIVNFKVVKTALNFDAEPITDEYSAEAWNSSWNTDDAVDKSQDISGFKFEDHLWLQECILSLSPALDVFAIAHEYHAVFLSSKWDVNEESNTKLKFVSSFQGKLSTNKDETITSLLCLPLASQKRSLQGGPDWSCIVVGYSSGFVRVYTEKAELLLSQLLHEEPIHSLKCKTYASQHFPNSADQPEELVIVYSTVVVTIDGFGLFQTLRACRNQLARAAAGKQEVAQPPPLSYKKFGLFRFVDCEVAGTVGASAFDHLVTESVRKGFYGAVKPTVPSCSLLVTTGSNPYVGCYHITEVASQLLLTDVVHAVASKLMSFITHSNAGGLIGGLIGRSEPAQQKDKPKIEPPTNLPLRFGLYDKRRQGVSVVLSPNKLLAAVSDAFGRVTLFDTVKGVAVRMWKGYRDAQCGWVEVEDDMQQKEQHTLFSSGRKKRAFFLVIYAPRRGILEVWCAQQGPRVAAFNVGKSGRLLFPGYTMVGSSFSAVNMPLQHLSACYFLDTEGYLIKVVVPFHLTLSERNSKHVRDLHLLKELRVLLKSSTKGRTIDIIKILKDMRTSNIRMQALNSLFSSSHSTVELVDTVVSGLLSHLEKQDPCEMDYKMKLLKQSCVRAQQLVKLHKVMNEINTKAIAGQKDSAPTDIQLFASTLCISETEVGRMQSYVTLYQTVVPLVKKQVRFLDDSATDLSFPDFMCFFNITDSPLQKTGDEVLTQNLFIDLKGSLSEKQMECLGGFLFHTALHVGGCHSTLQKALRESGLLPERLLHLLLCYWVTNSDFCEDPYKWLNLQQAMKQISSLSDPKLVCADSEHVSPWWKSVRDVLLQSTSNVSAYIGAIVARSVSIVMAAAFHVEMRNAAGDGKKQKDTEEKSDSGDSDWEAVSLDLEHWNLLIKQLEEVLLLSVLLKSQPYGKVVVRDVTVSISSLLNGGQGTVTDLVAVWAVCVGLQPKLLSSFFISDEDDNLSLPQKYVDESKADVQSLIMIKGIINELRKKFPYSLSHDVLLANCSWEHLMQWNRNKDSTEHLKQSLSCFDLIQSSVIKNGFASMMWKSCIQSKFEAFTLLVEKVGKTPKERLCRKELEMNDNRLEDFIEYCCELLNIILETSLVAEVEEVPKYQSEDFWQDREGQGPAPLILMALGQKISNNKTVYQHLILSTLLQLIITFQMKNSRPLGLFSAQTKKAFFRELHYNIKTTPKNDDSSLQSARTQFLMRAASCIAQSVPETIPDTPTSPPSVCTVAEGTTSYGLEGQRLASKWFNKVIDLGRDWELDLDDVRRHYVCELYSCGHDSLAEQVMSAVTEKTTLASQLLLISGQRIYKIIYESSDTVSKHGYLSPHLASWLKTLADRKLRCYNVPLESTMNLINHILVYLPEDDKKYDLAQALQDTLKGLAMISDQTVS